MSFQRDGELALYAPGFAEHLAAQGYTDKSITRQLGVLAHLDRWLDAQGLAPGQLNVEVVDRYLTARRAEGRRLYWSRRGMKPLLDHLSRVGEAPMPAGPPVTTAHERVLAPCRYYLVEERKLMAATVSNNEYYAGLFVSGLPIPVRVDLSSQHSAGYQRAARSLCNDGIHESNERGSLTVPNGPDSPARILVVDDEASIVDSVAAVLRYEGFVVDVASSGRVALQKAQDSPFDLMVLDVMLPDLDGREVARRIRSNGLDVPVLFLTAKSDVEARVAGLTVGSDECVSKPFSLIEIVARIRAILRRRQPPDEDQQLRFQTS